MGPGITRRAAHRQVARATDRPGLRDVPAGPPTALSHLWDWFCVLLPDFAEGSGAGLQAEIEARFGMTARPFEIRLLLRLFEVAEKAREESI